jgi:hypothetical protein
MTDGVGRRGRRDEDDDFGPPLFSDEPMTEALKSRYVCRCGAPKCRGTML